MKKRTWHRVDENGNPIDTPKSASYELMKKIDLKNGHLVCPAEWIILDNYTDPAEYDYAGVLEVRDPMDGSKSYAANHYVFFTDQKYAADYTDEMQDEVINAILDKDSSFQKIIDDLVEPEYNGRGESYECIVNKEAYFGSPWIGLFHIPVWGDEIMCVEGDEPPYCAIVFKKR